MRIEEATVRNFRSHRSTGPISVDNKLPLVGENNAGKSNFIDALRLFFSNSSKPHDPDDFHNRDFSENIEVEAWFGDLTEGEVDTFSKYMEGDRLWVKAAFPYDEEAESVASKDFYVKKSVLSHSELRNIGKKSADKCIRLYEEKFEDILEPYTSEVNWSGVNGASIERVVDEYASSAEAETERAEISPRGIQSDLHEYSPTLEVFESTRNIDDATKTHSNALLGNLLDSALEEVSKEKREEVEDSLSAIKTKLNERDRFEPIEQLEAGLNSRLSDQVSQVDDLRIDIGVPDIPDLLNRATVTIDDGFESNIEMMGTGFHMSFILSLLLEITNRETQKMMLCLEEPENNLHPHAQRKLYQTLDQLADQGHQIFLTTHSPHLVRPEDLDSIVRLHQDENGSKPHRLRSEDLSDHELQKIENHLTPEENDIFFARTVLFCEGPSEREALPILCEFLNDTRDKLFWRCLVKPPLPACGR